jgi:uncharacterized delta-60 repeat protein
MKGPTAYFIVFLLAMSFAVQTVFGGAVTLDPTFNGTGYLIQQINTDGALTKSIAIRADGMIVVGGYTRGPLSGTTITGFAAMCVNPNGTLNTGFDTDGWVITSFSNSNAGGPVLIQPDNKILLGGVRLSPTSDYDFTVLRYNTDGTLDTSFDGDGVAVLPVSASSNDVLVNMALQTDGKIVAVGWTAVQSSPTGPDVAIMRLNSNGSLDTSFDGDGILLVRNQEHETAESVAIQPDGKIVVGGYVTLNAIDSWQLFRFNSNGTPDTSFGTNGMVRIAVYYNTHATVATMALQADGKILAAGDNTFARLNSDGSVDGQVFTTGSDAHIQKILALGDGKIMIGYYVGAVVGVRVSRYNSNGTLDTTFNGSGSVTGSVPGNNCILSSIAMQADGRIVASGTCGESGGIAKFAVLRFRNAKSPYDFDGDGKTDISIYRPGEGEWWISKSSGGTSAAPFGSSSAVITPGNFTGDGKTDIAFWRAASGEWFVLRSEDNSYYSFQFGLNGDIPRVGDFDADGKADTAIFRPSNATWYIRRASGVETIQQFGLNGDVPVPADYDGDGKADIAIFRPANGQWWIQRSTAGTIAYTFGNSSDKPVPGDYTGDGKVDVAFWRPSTGEWFVIRSENNSFYSFPFGITGDLPAPGDYDGDEKFDAAIFRSSNGRWYVQRSTAGTLIQTFGQTGDRPVPNAFVP